MKVTTAALSMALSLTSGNLAHADGEIPFPKALNDAKIIQEKMTTEIPGSLIVGNGDLNGILWVNKGRLKFSITKNDVCDGRLDTSNDDDLVKVNIKERTYEGNMYAHPPSWAKPYPCPLICGAIDFGPVELEKFEMNNENAWTPKRSEGKNSFLHEKENTAPRARIEGRPGDSAGWGRSLKPLSGKQVTVKVSGSTNAKWYIEGQGQRFGSGWIPAESEPTEKTFTLPGNGSLSGIDFYIWTNDGKPAALDLHEIKIETNDGETVSVDFKGIPSGTPGEFLSLASRLPAAKVQAELDIARAVAKVAPKPGELVELRVLHDKNIIVFETDLPVELSPNKAGFIPDKEQGKTGDVEWINTQVPGDIDWEGMSFVLAHANQGKRHAVAVVSSFEADDPLSAAIKMAKAALEENPEKQQADHEAGWQKFWNRSGVKLSHSTLTNVWYRNLYFLRSCSKPGVEPIGLFMGAADDVMAWHGVATVDYNYQQCFAGAYAANHPELVEPFNRATVDYTPRAKWYANEVYGIDGVTYPVNLFVHQINDPLICKSKNNRQNAYPPYSYFFGVSGWMAQNVWNGYLYQPDETYLKSMAYPLIKECANFYVNVLNLCEVTEDGTVIYGPSYSPEHGSFGADNVACDIAWTRFTLKAAIHGAEILKKDADLVAKWKKALELVPDYPRLSTNPNLIADVKGGTAIQFNVAVPALPIFPAGEVNWFSDKEEKAAFLDTIRTINWTRYNSLIILTGAHARIAPRQEAQDWNLNEYQKREWPNGTLAMIHGTHPWASPTGDKSGNFTEQFGSVGVISEMLTQSVTTNGNEHIIRIFPAYADDASFERLLAKGGFEVSAEQKNAEIITLEIKSTAGGELKLLSPWKTIKVNGRVLVPDARGVVTIKTTTGKTYVFTS